MLLDCSLQLSNKPLLRLLLSMVTCGRLSSPGTSGRVYLGGCQRVLDVSDLPGSFKNCWKVLPTVNFVVFSGTDWLLLLRDVTCCARGTAVMREVWV